MWIWRDQWRSQLLGMFWGVAWMLSLALMPAMIGRAIDRGLLHHSAAGLWRWSAVVLGLSAFIAVAGGMRHRSALTNWLAAAYLTIQITSRHSVKVGADLPRLIASGEVLAVGTTDVEAIGGTYDIWARLSGSVVSVTAVAIILLTSSVPLGLVVLIGVPVMMVCTVLLLRPLRKRQDEYRELQGQLTDQTIDIAQGIRILRGIGGEETFSRRYAASSQRLRGLGVRVGRIEAILAGQEVLLPGLLTALVTWVAAHFALRGEITIGQLVAFYGYASFLVLPLSTFGQAADAFTRGHVAAGHVIRVLRLRPTVPDPGNPRTPPPAGSVLEDRTSGLVIRPGAFIAVACSEPQDAVDLSERLARYVDPNVPGSRSRQAGLAGQTGPSTSAVTSAARPEHAENPVATPQLGGVPIDELALSVVRERILLAGNADRIFSGSLRQSLSGVSSPSDDELRAALHAASAEDVLDALADGLDAVVEEKGRNFSGGQLQRLRLARALIADPEILLAVEATSAVDAHTEARIADRIGPYRASRDRRDGLGARRATVLFTTSPLVLDQADEVVYVEDGHVVSAGSHAELLAGTSGYRALVTRGEDIFEGAVPA